jgi:hypothetical protein
VLCHLHTVKVDSETYSHWNEVWSDKLYLHIHKEKNSIKNRFRTRQKHHILVTFIFCRSHNEPRLLYGIFVELSKFRFLTNTFQGPPFCTVNITYFCQQCYTSKRSTVHSRSLRTKNMYVNIKYNSVKTCDEKKACEHWTLNSHVLAMCQTGNGNLVDRFSKFPALFSISRAFHSCFLQRSLLSQSLSAFKLYSRTVTSLPNSFAICTTSEKHAVLTL